MTPEFRAWDKVKQEYSKNPLFIGKDGSIWDTCVGTYDLSDEVNDEMITEQYTRLKDVNGNKIFEGDILKLSYDDPKTYLYTDEYDCNPKIIPPKTVTRTVKVINEKGAFRVIALRIKLYGTRLLCDVDQGRENIEIIGNIHENPELLEVDE